MNSHWVFFVAMFFLLLKDLHVQIEIAIKQCFKHNNVSTLKRKIYAFNLIYPNVYLKCINFIHTFITPKDNIPLTRLSIHHEYQLRKKDGKYIL